MHPTILDPFFAPVTVFPNLRPTTAKWADKIGSLRVIDLLLHLPTSHIRRQLSQNINFARREEIPIVRLTIQRHQAPRPNNNMPYKIFAHDSMGTVVILVYFSTSKRFLKTLFPTDETRWVSGKIGWYRGRAQIAHPDYVVKEHDLAKIPQTEIIYKPLKSIPSSTISDVIRANINNIPQLPEWLDTRQLKENNWPDFVEAIKRVHSTALVTSDNAWISTKAKAIERLAYDELLAQQLAVAAPKLQQSSNVKQPVVRKRSIRKKILSNLPFKLTRSQVTAIEEIVTDIEQLSGRMVRLLQGDVGYGKTIVALLAAAAVTETNQQVAFMAPTDLLARQHFNTFCRFSLETGIQIDLLTGQEKGKKRKQILERTSNGEIDILIGTHAIIQKTVIFKDLTLAIIDEQHRFGVEQRSALREKGSAVGLLLMTATPIPRTSLMTDFGDIKVSRLLEKPMVCQPTVTRTISVNRIEELVSRLSVAIDNGAKVYWVCPLLVESTKRDIANAQTRRIYLDKQLGSVVGLIHGQMNSNDKNSAMHDFITSKTRVLVATTVIEVGIDVPDASIMVIEQAQRFGLAQLHQLRGRIGRGYQAPHCLLLYDEPISNTARARLNMIKSTEDGSEIAKQDLAIRGGGDITGVRQSGLANMRIASTELQKKFLLHARSEAKHILATDPNLSSHRGQALRLALRLFESTSSDNFQNEALLFN